VEYRRSAGAVHSTDDPAQPAGVAPAVRGGIEGIYVERGVALALLLVLTVGCVVVLKPFLPALLWAVILSVSSWPLYVRLERLLGGRRSLAALLMTTGVALVLLLPVVMLGVRLSESAAQATQMARQWFEVGLPPLPERLYRLPIIGARLQEFWQRVAQDRAELAVSVQPYIGVAREWLIALGGDLLQAILQVTIGLFVAFFFYRDGRTTVDMLSQIATRLTGPRSGRLLQAASNTVNGVVQGVLGTSLIQAVLMAVALRIAGVPAALFLGFVSFFLSLIPAGLTLLWLPAAIWFSSQGATGWAVFIAVSGLFVGTIDNWLRPLLIVKQSELPLVLILLGVLGGALVLGFLGIFVGPVLLAVGYSLLREWGSVETTAGIESR
jgi:predicted PurR-regulated permease PerM